MNQINFNSNRIINFKSTQDAQMQQQHQQTQIEQALPEVPLPQIYNIPSENNDEPTLVEKIKKFDMFGIIYPWLEYPLVLLATCTGMSIGLEKFSQACGGDYKKSLVGKVAKFGDNLENSKFVKSKPFQAVWKTGENAIGKVKHFFRNSDLLNAIFKTPSQPEWQMPKDELLGMRTRVVHEFSQIAKTLKWGEEGYTMLTDLGLDKKEHEFLKELFGDVKISKIEEQASNAIRLKRLGFEKEKIRSLISNSGITEIVKANELEKIGLTSEFIKKLEKETPNIKDIIRVERACNEGRKIRIGAGHQSFLGPFQPFERKASLAEISNKLRSMLKEGAKTKTGRFLATFIQKCHRGFTFGGHKMNAIFFVSPILVENMMDVKKAESGEKLGTAAHGLIHAISWVFTFPLALKVMHQLGGSQYAGMSKDDVAKYRELIKNFNEKANPFAEESWMNAFGIGKKKAADQTFQSYGEYKKALDELNVELKKLTSKNTKDQTLITKIGKQLGKFLTMDLETISSYKNGFHLGNFFKKKVPNFFKNVVGIPMRFVLWGAITMGIFDAIINKGIKGCFGNFYDRFKHEEFINSKKEQKKFLKQDLKARLMEANQMKAYNLSNPDVQMNFSEQDASNLIPNTDTPKAQTSSTNELKPIQAQNDLKPFVKDLEKEVVSKTPDVQQDLNSANSIQEQEKTTPIPEIKAEQTNTVSEPKITSDTKTFTPQEKIESHPELSTKDSIQTSLPKAQEAKEANNTLKEFNNQKQFSTKIDPIIEQKIPQQIELETPKVKDNYTYIPSSVALNTRKDVKTQKRDNYTYIPSSENIIKKNQKSGDTNKYIPSQMGVKFNKTFDNSGLEAALRRADRAEQRAIQVLAGNFNNV